jgi:DNA-binding XRE family transcriptional regulator
MAAEHIDKRVRRKPKRRASKAVLARRVLVSQMMARRVTQGNMAKLLGVSRGTIVKDVKAIEAEWREDMLGNITTIKARELAELSYIEGEAWVGFQRSRPSVKAGAPQHPGDPKWLRVILDVKKRRSDLIGLDAPIEIRHGLADKELREMTDDELDELARQIATGQLPDVVLH